MCVTTEVSPSPSLAAAVTGINNHSIGELNSQTIPPKQLVATLSLHVLPLDKRLSISPISGGDYYISLHKSATCKNVRTLQNVLHMHLSFTVVCCDTA